MIKDLTKKLEGLDSIKLKIEEYEKPILIVEDKFDAIYKISYLKLNDIDCDENSYSELFRKHCNFTIRRAEGVGAVAGILSMNNTDGYDDKKLVGLFDFDKAGSERFYRLKSQNNWDAIIKGDTLTGLYKQRNQHPCFYALLIPIPERHTLISNIKEGVFDSYVEIENLLPDEILKSNGLVDEKSIFGNKYLKIKENVKNNIDKILCGLNKEDFNDFIPLFDKIDNLFSE